MKYFITPSLIKQKYIRVCVCVCMYMTICVKNMETRKVCDLNLGRIMDDFHFHLYPFVSWFEKCFS